jgi:hypothetical protein
MAFNVLQYQFSARQQFENLQFTISYYGKESNWKGSVSLYFMVVITVLLKQRNVSYMRC